MGSWYNKEATVAKQSESKVRKLGHGTKSGFYDECKRKVLKCTIWSA